MESISIPVGEIGSLETGWDFRSHYQRGVRRFGLGLANLGRFWFRSFLSPLLYSLIIAAVAVYDIVLTIQYAELLAQMEANPIGRWLMGAEYTDIYAIEAPPNVWLFLFMKGFGTLIVLGVVNGLIRWRLNLGHAVATGVSLFQIGLAAYLWY